MTNEEIQNAINDLQSQFMKNNFTYNPQNKQIMQKIIELQDLCTHKKGAENFTFNDGRCKYCGRRIISE